MPHPTQPRIGGPPVLLRHARSGDGAGMWALAGRAGLDLNSPYAYVVWPHHHRRTTVVAERDGEVVGFVLGYLVPDTRDLFVWQVGIDAWARGRGIAGRLLDMVAAGVRPDALEATVTPSNGASDALFRSFARRHGGRLARTPCFPASVFPDDHDEEVLYRIDLRPGRHRRRPPEQGDIESGPV